MNSFFKKVAMTTAICATIAATPMAVNASSNENPTVEISQTLDRQPRVNWTGSAYISDSNYTNITSSNNLFPDSPKVTNNSGNPGTVTFRIVNSSGAVVGSAKSCAAGKSVTMDQIPAGSGTYTLQAKAEKGKSGNYTIAID